MFAPHKTYERGLPLHNHEKRSMEGSMGLFQKTALRVMVNQQMRYNGKFLQLRSRWLHGKSLQRQPRRRGTIVLTILLVISAYGKMTAYSFHSHFAWFCLKIVILTGFSEESGGACFYFNIEVTERVTRGLASSTEDRLLLLKSTPRRRKRSPRSGFQRGRGQQLHKRGSLGKELPGRVVGTALVLSAGWSPTPQCRTISICFGSLLLQWDLSHSTLLTSPKISKKD